MADELTSNIEELQERISLNPADAEAHSLLGDALIKERRWQEAVAAWQEALRLDPEDDHAQFCIAVAISGQEPFVKPSAELLAFLVENSDGHYLELGQALGAIPKGFAGE